MKKRVIVMMLAITTAMTAITGCSKAEKDNTTINTSEEKDETKTEEKETENSESDEEDIIADEEENEEASAEPEESEDNQNSLSTSTPVARDYEAVFREELDYIYKLLSSPNEVDQYAIAGTNGISEYAFWGSDPLNDVGYALEDLNGDGVSELIIAEVEVYNCYGYPGNGILAIYSCLVDSKLCLAEGWSRCSNYLLSDNGIFVSGSNSAECSVTEIKRINADGSGYTNDAFYYTGYSRADDTFVVYSNLNGVIENDPAYLTDMSIDELNNLAEQYRASSRYVTVKPFSQYGQ